MSDRMSPVFDAQKQPPIRPNTSAKVWAPAEFKPVAPPKGQAAVMKRWTSPLRSAEEKAEAEARTRAAVATLLRCRRLTFPDVPVIVDGETLPPAMLDDAFALIPRFDPEPLATLARLLLPGGVVAEAWKDPMRAKQRSGIERRREESVAADLADDIAGGINPHDLRAPLIITTVKGA